MSAPRARVSLVVGAGGLLGTALSTALRAHGDHVVAAAPVAWTTRRAGADLRAVVRGLADTVAETQSPWRVAWCAGAGVTGTGEDVLDQEVETLSRFLADLAAEPRLGRGTFFLASSAGALYAGCGREGPFDETVEPRPISAYGHAKLAAERAAGEFAAATGSQVLIGRIANLYGPNQDLAKAQGLISHLCRGYLTRQPVSIYVALDTIRDYLFVDDCAAMVADMLDNSSAYQPDGVAMIVKVLASGQPTTIATLITVCRQVFKRPPRLVLGTSTQARLQVRDLRLRSVCWPELDRRSLTCLPAGIAATVAGMRRANQISPD